MNSNYRLVLLLSLASPAQTVSFCPVLFGSCGGTNTRGTKVFMFITMYLGTPQMSTKSPTGEEVLAEHTHIPSAVMHAVVPSFFSGSI